MKCIYCSLQDMVCQLIWSVFLCCEGEANCPGVLWPSCITLILDTCYLQVHHRSHCWALQQDCTEVKCHCKNWLKCTWNSVHKLHFFKLGWKKKEGRIRHSLKRWYCSHLDSISSLSPLIHALISSWSLWKDVEFCFLVESATSD